MSHLASYLGIILALLTGAFIGIFASDDISPKSVPVSTEALSTLSVVPGIIESPLTLPRLDLSGVSAIASTTTEDTATSSLMAVADKSIVSPVKVEKKIVAQQVATSTASAPVSAPAPATTMQASSGSASLDTAASALRAALVNIICNVPAGSRLHSISGSGVFIDAKGIILTNAHIAQYFLLADRGASCTIRAGSPAVGAYKASLIYISPLWVRNNAKVLTQALPVGTGEYDFALLAVTSSATSASLPSAFPAVPLAQSAPTSGTPVVIASYGAQFIDVSQIQASLFPTIVFGSVKDIYTFALNSIDIIGLGGSAAAQEGSSGGGVADASGSLIATITTSTVEGSTDTRSLSAITASYIRAEYAREMGLSLDSLLNESTDYAIRDFAPQIPILEAILTPYL